MLVAWTNIQIEKGFRYLGIVECSRTYERGLEKLYEKQEWKERSKEKGGEGRKE